MVFFWTLWAQIKQMFTSTTIRLYSSPIRFCLPRNKAGIFILQWLISVGVSYPIHSEREYSERTNTCLKQSVSLCIINALRLHTFDGSMSPSNPFFLSNLLSWKGYMLMATVKPGYRWHIRTISKGCLKEKQRDALKVHRVKLIV